MTREELITEAIRWKDGRIDFLIMEKGVNPYHLLADFAELMIKKREKEIVEKLKAQEDYWWTDQVWGGEMFKIAIDIVEGKND